MESTTGKNWTEEDEKLLLETIDKWVENEVKPIAREYDQEDKYPHELVESMKDLGLFGGVHPTPEIKIYLYTKFEVNRRELETF